MQATPDSDVLAIFLEPIDAVCELGADWLRTARVNWRVEGGEAPYEVWINGEEQKGESGHLEVLCVGLTGGDFRSWEQNQQPRPVNVVATVIDAQGEQASDLLLIERPVWRVENPANVTREFDGRVDSLTLELFAPMICEAFQWGSQRNFPNSQSDPVTMEVAWRVSGGQPPYEIHIAEQVFRQAEGSVDVQCRHFEDGVLDSGLIGVAGYVQDSVGATGSSVVQTFALARTSSRQERGHLLLNGGRTYRFERVLMTIPEGLTIDVSGGWESVDVSCEPGTCEDASCANELNDNVCENSFTLSTTQASVWASFGEKTLGMKGRGQIREHWPDDPGVLADSIDEVQSMINAWAESVGKLPDLSDARWISPLPLQLSVVADPPNCDRASGRGNVVVSVRGGAWVPSTIVANGRIIGFSRSSGSLRHRFDCSLEVASRVLRVMAVGPGGETVRAEVFLSFPVHWSEQESMSLQSFVDLGLHSVGPESTAFCELGGKAKIRWEVRGADPPVVVQINGQRLEAEQSGFLDKHWETGIVWIDCADSPGPQIVQLEAADSSSPTQHSQLQLAIEVVAEHPSGRSWEELRPHDYPE